ncbi:MAG: hypothetical protein IPK48_02100 [Gammaproteobacteria bacterium]|nr:hypothetical protein [Gammaproteobacteria bacterium]
MVAVRPALRDDLFVMRRLNAVTPKIIAHKNNEIDLVIRHRSIFHAERNFPLRKFPGALVPRSKERDFIAACVVGHAYVAQYFSLAGCPQGPRSPRSLNRECLRQRPAGRAFR